MDLTFLQSIPAHVFGIALGVVGVLLVSLICWRLTVISRRVEVYRAALGKFWKAVSASEAVYKQLTGDPAGLVFQASAFSGKTKIEYEHDRQSWLNWINWRALAEERRDRAEVSYRKHCHRRWTQCFGKRHLEAAIDALLSEPITGVGQSLPASLGAVTASLSPVHGNCDALPGLITDSLSAVTSSFQRFTKIVADAAANRRNIDSEFSNTIADDRAGIEYLCSQLLQSGLALSPYEQRLTELRSTRDELLAQLTEDPIGVAEQAITAHMQKIGMLRRSFLDAIKYKRSLEALRGRYVRVSSESGEMFGRPPASVIASVQFTGNFSFAEPKFELKPLLCECGDGIQELETLLLEGHLIKFGRALDKVGKDVGSVEKLFARIVEDKGRVDEVYGTILTLSSQTDSAYDEPELSKLRALYTSQKWNAAVKVAEALLNRCQGRARVRQHFSVLEQHQVRLAGRIHDLAAVVSEQLDGVLAERHTQCVALGVRAQSPDADVDALIADIEALTEELVGEKPESLESLLEAELALQLRVTTGLQDLVARMTDVTAKVGENWGGRAAGEKLGAIQHLLGPIVADGKQNKPDWQRLLERVTETLGLLEPVRDLVYAEIKRHQTLTVAIESTEQFVASLAGEHYKRTICGIVFGASLYCSNSGLTELVDQARQQLGARDYDSAVRALTELKSKVGRNHVECCWMLLQSMACTTEPCAVRYAHENGYCDGMFEQWAEQRLRNAEGDSFQVFQLPELVSGKNHSRSGSLTLSDAVDEPVVTDYEPAYEA